MSRTRVPPHGLGLVLPALAGTRLTRGLSRPSGVPVVCLLADLPTFVTITPRTREEGVGVHNFACMAPVLL